MDTLNDDATTDVDGLIAQTSAPLLVKAGAIVSAFTGLFATLTGVQLLGARFAVEALNSVDVLLLGLGLGHLVMAVMQHRGRALGVFGLGPLALVTSAVAAGLFLYLLGQLFSLTMVLTAGLAPMTLALWAMGLPGALRMMRARRQLEDEGLNLGL